MLMSKKAKMTQLCVISLCYILTMVLIFCGLYFLMRPTAPTEEETPIISGGASGDFLSEVIAPAEAQSELRAVWIATVSNINYPSSRRLTEHTLKEELKSIVEKTASLGANAIFFQVRPCGDALYESALFPYSHYVSGKRGSAPDNKTDILAELITLAHQRGIAVHAWINPVRVLPGSPADPARRDELCAWEAAALHPEWAIVYADGRMYYDIGIPEVRSYIADGVYEIVSQYDVDGVVFDDYFYPYPVYDTSGSLSLFDDTATYKKYGGKQTLGDFRRESVRSLVRACSIAAKKDDRSVMFGISPFGVWKNSLSDGGAGTSGLESYYDIYCDSLSFAREGLVDYIAPQLYWEIGSSTCDYYLLAQWWNKNLAETRCAFIPCLAPYRYEEGRYESGEITRQLKYAKTLSAYNGAALYGFSALCNDSLPVGSEVKAIWK